ncbi:MAG TPA: energy-coupling factor transporter transmembrane component T [Clostridia bacterium]
MDLHKSNNRARLKMVLCVILVIGIGIIKSKEILASYTFVVFLILVISHKRNGIKLLTIGAILLLASALGLVQTLTIGDNAAFTMNMIIFKINIYKEGLNYGITSFLKISGSMGTIALTMHSVNFEEFMDALRWLKLPEAFIEVMTFALKFVYIFKEEATSVIKAQKCRLGYKGAKRSIISISSAAGIVLIRAYDRSIILSKSMRSRGYHANT